MIFITKIIFIKKFLDYKNSGYKEIIGKILKEGANFNSYYNYQYMYYLRLKKYY